MTRNRLVTRALNLDTREGWGTNEIAAEGSSADRGGVCLGDVSGVAERSPGVGVARSRVGPARAPVAEHPAGGCVPVFLRRSECPPGAPACQLRHGLAVPRDPGRGLHGIHARRGCSADIAARAVDHVLGQHRRCLHGGRDGTRVRTAAAGTQGHAGCASGTGTGPGDPGIAAPARGQRDVRRAHAHPDAGVRQHDVLPGGHGRDPGRAGHGERRGRVPGPLAAGGYDLFGGLTLTRMLEFASTTSYQAVTAGTQVVRVMGNGEDASLDLSLPADTIHTLVVLDGPGGLRISDLEDAAGSQVRPSGGVATGLGGTASHPARSPLPWLTLIAAGTLLAGVGARRYRQIQLAGARTR